jgi:ligand-binding sensor domain-containing protein
MQKIRNVVLGLVGSVFIVSGILACSSNNESADESAALQAPVKNNNEAIVNNLPEESAPPPALKAQEKVENERPYYVAEAFAVGRDVYVRSLEINDATNTAWVGTSVGALEVNLTSKEVNGTYTRREGLANEYVFAILNDSEGRTWYGSNGGGVSRYYQGEWKTYFPMHGLADYWVYSFAEQADKTIWIGTWAGVNHLNPETGEFKTYVKELINEWVYGIAVDGLNRVWFGTEGGVSMFDGAAWKSWNHEDGLGAPNTQNLPISTNTGLGTRSRHDLNTLSDGQETYNPNYVFCVMVDQKGDIWAGTWGGGVSRFDGQKWHNLNNENGLAGNVVFSMAQDAKGVYWFGTDKGLSSYDGNNWHTYTHQDGLLSNSVYAVHAVSNGEIWAGTKSGVARMAPKP